MGKNTGNNSGLFQKNLLSLKLLLETLFDEVGGADVLELLDTLSTLSAEEKTIALKMMNRVCQRLGATGTRLFSKNEQRMKDLEDLIVRDITEELSEKISGKLCLVQGGKVPSSNSKNKTEITVSRTNKILEFKPTLN